MARTVIPTADLKEKKGGKAYADWMEVAILILKKKRAKEKERNHN